MRHLKSRIERIEKIIASDEVPQFFLFELYQFDLLKDPKKFREEAMDPACRNRIIMQEALHTPISKKVLRHFRRNQLEQLTKVPASSSDRSRETSPEEKHESPQSPGRKPK